MASDTSVYISNKSVHIVKGRYSQKNININNISEYKIENNCIINGVITDSALLKDYLENSGIAAKSVKLVIDGSSVITRLLEIPQLKPDKITAVIETEFQDIENHENMISDYMVVKGETESGGALILATLVERDFIAQYVEIFEGLKIKTESIDISLACMIRYILSIRELESDTFVYSVIDTNTITLSLFVNGEYRFSRRSRLMAENTDELYEELVKLLSNMIQFNKSEKNNHDITGFYFSGISAAENILYSKLSEALGVTASAAPIPEKIKYSGSMNINNYIYAIGNFI